MQQCAIWGGGGGGGGGGGLGLKSLRGGKTFSFPKETTRLGRLPVGSTRIALSSLPPYSQSSSFPHNSPDLVDSFGQPTTFRNELD